MPTCHGVRTEHDLDVPHPRAPQDVGRWLQRILQSLKARLRKVKLVRLSK